MEIVLSRTTHEVLIVRQCANLLSLRNTLFKILAKPIWILVSSNLTQIVLQLEF